MIKVNLIREPRAATRDSGSAKATPVATRSSAPANINNLLIIGLLVLSIAACVGWWLMKKNELKKKEAQVVAAREEARKLESIIAEVEAFQKRKESLEKRIGLINQLKQAQKGPVRVMDKVSLLLPDLVWLTSMNVTGTKVSVEGKALNPNAVANYVENIKSDPMFDEPVVSGLNQATEANTTIYSFGMGFNFTYATDTAGTPGAPGAPPAAPPVGAASTPAAAGG